MSTTSTRRCADARNADTLMDVRVFPHPPFWLTTAIVRIHRPPWSMAVGPSSSAESSTRDRAVGRPPTRRYQGLPSRQKLFVGVELPRYHHIWVLLSPP